MSETYVVVHLAGIQEDDIGGFINAEEAWGYIKDNCLCANCQDDIVQFNEDIYETGCGSEWDVLSLSKYKTLTNRKQD